MTEEMKIKLSSFIDILLCNKFDEIIFDKWKDARKKHNYYSIDIDTGVKINNPTYPLLTQFIHFAVCPESGLVILCKDEYEEFKECDIEFAKKYYEILKEFDYKKSLKNLEDIIDSSMKELKLSRDENIKKLIGQVRYNKKIS